MRRRDRGDVAIVGMACRFPGAADLVAFWENIVAGVDATGPVPADRWDPAAYFDPATAATRRGGYLDAPIPFDPARHGVMPRAVAGGEPEQFLVLDAARAALDDAGLPDGPVDGRRAEVVVARGNYFNRGNLARLSHGRILAQTLAVLGSLHPEWTADDRDAVRAELAADLPPFEAATIPGQLTNATAGRVNDRLDLAGASFVVDAASASALVALDLAARSLVARRADLAVVGAVYLEADVDFPLVFDRLGALSRSGRARPLAVDADGLLSGEGVGVVVLKRLADAERAGDRIYAVVRGVGVAADGRGRGLAAPSARGHARAIRRAYRAAGVDPAGVGLIEGHGLGLPAADRAELRALRATFPPARPGRRALGAVSSMIGHAMPAAGMAGLIKAALALHHRTLPPTLHADRPHPLLLDPASPARLNPTARPWVHGATDGPRLAGVNAFGFAGINAHAVLAAHPSSDRDDAPGALVTWETEAFLLAGRDRDDLADRAAALVDRLAAHPGANPKDLAFTLNTAVDRDLPARLGLVAGSVAELVDRLAGVIPRLRDPATRSIRDARGAYCFDRGASAAPPRVAFLFPGEGSQYPGMLGDLAPHFPEVRALLDTSDRLARRAGDPDAPWPSEVLFGQADAAGGLWSAEVAVNVVLSAQWALYRLLRRLGIKPDAVLGHSSGEFLALAAAGVTDVDAAFEDGMGVMAGLFGRLEHDGSLPAARLVAVAADRARVEAAIAVARPAGPVAVAMDNCPHQVVIAGEPSGVDAVVEGLKAQGIACEVLPFARAYHTPAFAPAVGPIGDFFASLPLRPPAVPIYSCAGGRRLPDDPAAIERLAVAQWTEAVEFRAAVGAMHADGVDVFVDVGARGNLAGFVEDTLRGRPALAVAANLPRRSGPTQLNHLVATLFARGVALDPAHLYARRRPRRVDLAAAPVAPLTIPALAVGFPTMRLSDELIARLRDRPAALPASNGRAKHEYAPSARDEFPPVGPGPAAHINGRAVEAANEGTSVGDDHGEGLDPTPPGAEPAATVMLDFQRTMTDFLAAQGEVVRSFLGAGHGLAPAPPEQEGDEFEFRLDRTARTPAPTPATAGPWAGELVALDPGVAAVARIRLDITGDPVAEHHTLGGRRISASHPEWRGLPVLPFSVMAEMLAQAAARLAPAGWTVVALRNVRAHRWVRYEEGATVTLEVHAAARPEADAATEQSYLVAIHNRGTADDGRPPEPPVFEGEVVFAATPLEPPAVGPFDLPAARPCRFTAGSIYGEQWLFHGPALRAVAAIGPIAPGGIVGTLRVLPRGPLLRDPAGADRLHTDPIILDNFTHLLGGWGLDELADRGDVIFPLRMGELLIFGGQPPDGTPIECRVAVEEAGRHQVRAGADLVRPDGTAWMTIRGWEDWRFHWPGQYRDGFRAPDRTFLGEALPLPGLDPTVAAAAWLEPPGDMGRPVWRDVLEHVQLGPDERAEHLARVGDDEDRTRRLWGRIAAKEAARRVDQARGLPPTYPADWVATADERGRPILDRRDDPAGATPIVAVAHADGVAVALAVFDPTATVGIAVEPIAGGPPGPAVSDLTALEQGLLAGRYNGEADRPAMLALVRAAKVAVARATGRDGPAAVEVVALPPGEPAPGAPVALHLEVRGGPPGRTIVAVAAVRDGFAWAWTMGGGSDR